MTKKLITVMWAISLEVEVPDDATVESLADWEGPHANLTSDIVAEASNNLSWKSGEITAIDEIPPDGEPE